jgi:hypothetical protein
VEEVKFAQMNQQQFILYPTRFPLWLLVILSVAFIQCKKDHKRALDNLPSYPSRLVHYKVSGTNVRLDYIDSTSTFLTDQPLNGNFDYEFRRGPGTQIGINVDPADSTGAVFSWEIYIDNKLFANAFSRGGAYFIIPYP